MAEAFDEMNKQVAEIGSSPAIEVVIVLEPSEYFSDHDQDDPDDTELRVTRVEVTI